MQGREFLDLAREILVGGTEVHWRGALGRAYYALMLESRDTLLRWGVVAPPRDNIHTFVRLRMTYPSHADLKKIGGTLDILSRRRNQADYDLTRPGLFQSNVATQNALQEVNAAIAILDAIEADPAKKAAAIAAIRKAFP